MSGLGSKARCVDTALAPLTAPISRPILFSGPMVRALLAGTKTQTRRALKHQPIDIIPMPKEPDRQWVILKQREPEPKGKVVRCRFGVPGDLLWVRETWAHVPIRGSDGGQGDEMGPIYRADGEEAFKDFTGPWRPSIFMPRKYSRITLRITDVRVERLQKITETDAAAEGVYRDEDRPEERRKGAFCPNCADTGLNMGVDPGSGGAQFDTDCTDCDSYVKRYRWLWDSINGPNSWASNPWVWAVLFERAEKKAGS